MDASDCVTALRARYVFPVIGPPIEGGIVTFCGERIVAVGKTSDVPATDLGNKAIVPGIVNAHTHLEFSDLTAPLGEPGEPLPTWIRRVISYRREHPDVAVTAINSGILESQRAGVTAIGEIDTGGWSRSQEATPATMTVFREVIKLDDAHPDAFFDSIERELTQLTTNHSIPGLSPHAPYSVHPRLFGPLLEFARRKNYPVAMHLAESPEEMELLSRGVGPFRDLLEELGVWRDEASPVGLRPLHYMRVLCDAPRALVVHGNYLDEEEIEFLAAKRDRLTVAYCPRTHAYFGHKPYPLHRLWSSGARICIGTDSRASNPNLNMLDELKFAASHHPSVPPREILQFGTLNGAWMLSGGDQFGALAAPQRADFAVIQLPGHAAADPHELLFGDESRVVQTWYGGKLQGRLGVNP